MVIALQEEATRLGFIAIESDDSGSRDLQVLVIDLAIRCPFANPRVLAYRAATVKESVGRRR